MKHIKNVLPLVVATAELRAAARDYTRVCDFGETDEIINKAWAQLRVAAIEFAESLTEAEKGVKL